MFVETPWSTDHESFEVKRFPHTPKLYSDETLHSWIMRLGFVYGHSTISVLSLFGMRPNAWRRTLRPEVDLPKAFYNAVSSAMGLAQHRLRPNLTIGPHSLLQIQDRTGFCARCWAERKRLDAAYLSYRWAREWSFTCRIHNAPLWDVESAAATYRWESWNECFADRSAWAALARQEYSGVWIDVCSQLALDPIKEWDEAQPILRMLQDLHEALDPGVSEADPVILVVNDLANMLQIDWSEATDPERLTCAVRHWRDDGVCTDRSLRGPLKVRLMAAVIAIRLFRVLCNSNEDASDSLKHIRYVVLPRFVREGKGKWWVLRRIHLWPSAYRDAGLALFQLSRDDLIVWPATRECDTCLAHARNHCFRVMNKVRATDAWLCEFDAWFPRGANLCKPTDFAAVGASLQRYTADHFQRQRLVRN